MKLDWDMLTNQDFEELCYDILNQERFVNIVWQGRGGGDRARDITCSKSETILGNIVTETHYLVQCKKYLARPPSPSDLNDAIAWADAHSPHVLLLMVSNTMSSDTHDWLEKIAKKKSYQILTYEEKDFEHYLEKNQDLYMRYFERKELKTPLRITPDEMQTTVLMGLVDKSKKSIEDISRETSEPVSKVEPLVDKFLSEGILCSDETDHPEFSLRTDLAAFIKVAKDLLSTDQRYDFLVSSYSTDMINIDLADYIESRYFLKLSGPVKTGLMRVLNISPSALSYCLFSDNRLYRTGHDQVHSLKIPDEMRRKMADSFVRSFISSLLEKLVADLRNPESKKTLQQSNIEGVRFELGVRMANSQELVMDMSSESILMLMKAKGKIEAGSLLSATDPALFTRVGTILMNLGLLEPALDEYDLSIEMARDKEQLKVAWNNKGVCLMRLQRWYDAIHCFDEALKIDPSLHETQKNRQECLDRIQSSL